MKYTAILKLKQMLDEAKIPYQSFDDDLFGMKEKGIPSARFNPAYCLQLNKNIDVIQHCGSYGNEQDLLEIQGALTVEEREQSSVLGHLTAEEVFKRFKYCYEHNTTVYVDEERVITDKEREVEKMVEIAHEYSKDIANTPYYKGTRTDMEAIYDAGYRKVDASFERYLLDKLLHSAEDYCAYCANAPTNEACRSENTDDCRAGIRAFYEKFVEEK